MLFSYTLNCIKPPNQLLNIVNIKFPSFAQLFLIFYIQLNPLHFVLSGFDWFCQFKSGSNRRTERKVLPLQERLVHRSSPIRPQAKLIDSCCRRSVFIDLKVFYRVLGCHATGKLCLFLHSQISSLKRTLFNTYFSLLIFLTLGHCLLDPIILLYLFNDVI